MNKAMSRMVCSYHVFLEMVYMQSNDTLVGISRQQTREDRPPAPPPKDDEPFMNGLELQKTMTQGQMNGGTRLQPLNNHETVTDGRLFTEDELAQAMSQSSLKATKRGRETLL